MVDLNHVALFARVVETGSFSTAARALGVPKSTISRQIAKLEADLGARLLHRTTRKLELTALGRRYYDEASEGLSRLAAATDHLSATQRFGGEVLLSGWNSASMGVTDDGQGGQVGLAALRGGGALNLVDGDMELAQKVVRAASSSLAGTQSSSVVVGNFLTLP